MKEWDIFEALTELDDDILCAAELPAKQNHTLRRSVRIGLIAAVLALLATTAFAVRMNTVKHGKKTVTLEGVSVSRHAPSETTAYYTAEIACELQPVEIRQMDTLRTALTKAWEAFPYDAQHFTRAELTDAAGERMSFGSLTAAGAYFDLKLPYSPRIDRMTRHVTADLIVTDTGRAAEEYRTTGTVTPDGLILQCVLRRDRDGEGLDASTAATGSLTVYIALNETFAAQERVLFLSSHVNEGDFYEFGMLTEEGKSLLLLENSPLDGRSATGYAIWCTDGIVCRAELKTLPNASATPLSLLTPLLSDIQ